MIRTRLEAPLALAAALGLLVLAAPLRPASADGGGSAPPAPSTPTPALPEQRPLSAAEKAALEAQRAEELYASTYREVEKADRELAEAAGLAAGGDAKSREKAGKKRASARKRLAKAVERFREVTAVLPRKADAWNMLGYSLRMTGEVQPAFQAYWKCLEIEPEHLGAHEYLGETYLMEGRLEDAKAELAWLEKKGAKREAEKLAWQAERPQAERPQAEDPQAEPLRKAAAGSE